MGLFGKISLDQKILGKCTFKLSQNDYYIPKADQGKESGTLKSSKNLKFVIRIYLQKWLYSHLTVGPDEL
jgi:hypothetical protein